jgi:hypothetical protein
MYSKDQYYVMYEAIMDDGTPVWLGVSDEGIEILSNRGDIIKEYKTTYDPRLTLCTIH